MQLSPLKVKIRLKPNGHARYPDFSSLAVIAATGRDWSQYVDAEGTGWLYDCCGHKEEEAGSPIGEQWGVILAPLVFVNQAVAAFPAVCAKLTEAQLETFYDLQHAKDFEDEEIDDTIVGAIKLKQDLGQTLTAQQLEALDPTNPRRGIRKNKRKKWVDFKASKGITVTQ